MSNDIRYCELVPGDVLLWRDTNMRSVTKARDVLLVISVMHYDGYVNIVFDKWLTQPLDYGTDVAIDCCYWTVVR